MARKKEKRLHGPGLEPGTPAVLRQCHNQLDHPRLVSTLVTNCVKYVYATSLILARLNAVIGRLRVIAKHFLNNNLKYTFTTLNISNALT